MEEPKINSLQQMYVGFAALNSFLGMLTQHHPEMTVLRVEFENKNSFQEHQCCVRMRVHPKDHMTCEIFSAVLMRQQNVSTFEHTIDGTESIAGYDLLTSETSYASVDKSLYLTISSTERVYHEKKISDCEEGSIMAIMSDIKQKADQILEGS